MIETEITARSIIPEDGSTAELGSPTKRWRIGYFHTVDVTGGRIFIDGQTLPEYIASNTPDPVAPYEVDILKDKIGKAEKQIALLRNEVQDLVEQLKGLLAAFDREGKLDG